MIGNEGGFVRELLRSVSQGGDSMQSVSSSCARGATISRRNLIKKHNHEDDCSVV